MDRAYQQSDEGRKGAYDKGHYDDAASGYKGKAGNNEYHDYRNDYGRHGGQNGGATQGFVQQDSEDDGGYDSGYEPY